MTGQWRLHNAQSLREGDIRPSSPTQWPSSHCISVTSCPDSGNNSTNTLCSLLLLLLPHEHTQEDTHSHKEKDRKKDFSLRGQLCHAGLLADV